VSIPTPPVGLVAVSPKPVPPRAMAAPGRGDRARTPPHPRPPPATPPSSHRRSRLSPTAGPLLCHRCLLIAPDPLRAVAPRSSPRSLPVAADPTSNTPQLHTPSKTTRHRSSCANRHETSGPPHKWCPYSLWDLGPCRTDPCLASFPCNILASVRMSGHSSRCPSQEGSDRRALRPLDHRSVDCCAGSPARRRKRRR